MYFPGYQPNRLQLQGQHRLDQQAIAAESTWSASSYKAGSTGYSFRVNMVSQQPPGLVNRLQLQSQHGQLAASRLGQQAIASESTWSASSYQAGSTGYSFRVNMVSQQLQGQVNRLQLQGQHGQLAATRPGQQAIASESTWSASSYQAGSTGFSFRVNIVSYSRQGQQSTIVSRIFQKCVGTKEMCQLLKNQESTVQVLRTSGH